MNEDVYILAIESSCDETSFSIVKNGKIDIATSISSQIDIHKNYGGVVPEIASREHLKNFIFVLKEVLEKSKLEIKDIDAIAVTYGPGLIGSLLIGVEIAKTLSLIYKKPLIAVNHMIGHIYSNNLNTDFVFPALILIVSGGHTDLVLMDNSFTSLPSGVKIGNRIMLSIEMIAILFFHKIILGVTILFTTMIAGVNYPFLPRHITYMNFILVTMPTVLTTLFPPIPKAKINPKNFWRDTLYSIAPVAILSGLAISFIYVSLYIKVGGDFASRPIMHGILATVVIATAWFGVFATILSEIFLGSKPSKNNKIRRTIYIIGTLIFTGVIFSAPILREFFEFNLPNISQFWFVCAVIILVSVVQLFIASNRSKNK